MFLYDILYFGKVIIPIGSTIKEHSAIDSHVDIGDISIMTLQYTKTWSLGDWTPVDFEQHDITGEESPS